MSGFQRLFHILLQTVACNLILFFVVSCHSNTENSLTADETEGAIDEVRYEYGIPVDSFYCVAGTVGKGETLGGIFGRLGAGQQLINQLGLLSPAEFDVRQIRPQKSYLAFYSLDSVLCYFVYQQDLIHSVVMDVRDTLHIEKVQKPLKHHTECKEVVIESSLWNAFTSVGANPQLAIELSDIYAWTVDFFGLQQGDRFRVYYTESFADTIPVGITRIHAATYYHGADSLPAYYFSNEDLSGYFDGQGNSLRKAFLKAPLNYKRISSTFTYHRKHPIFKTVRPHTGVDYAAPVGTPVVSIGDGVVIEKGYKGGGGNTVKIRHNSTYTTAYLHLSKYGKDIQVGKRVSQGQVIGYVGSTGNSTGPHLDFRVWKNGTPVNPLTMEAPPVEPIPEKYKEDYQATVFALQHFLH